MGFLETVKKSFGLETESEKAVKDAMDIIKPKTETEKAMEDVHGMHTEPKPESEIDAGIRIAREALVAQEIKEAEAKEKGIDLARKKIAVSESDAAVNEVVDTYNKEMEEGVDITDDIEKAA